MFVFTLCRSRAMARESGGTSSVMVLPAAVYAPSPMVTGATRLVLQPINAPSPMVVRNFVNSSQLNESVVEDEVVIGPFAYIRPHCLLMKKAKVGDFVELKNDHVLHILSSFVYFLFPLFYFHPPHRGQMDKLGGTIGEGTKISHLTYVGDTDAGAHINFGCGTVTVNYDGANTGFAFPEKILMSFPCEIMFSTWLI